MKIQYVVSCSRRR